MIKFSSRDPPAIYRTEIYDPAAKITLWSSKARLKDEVSSEKVTDLADNKPFATKPPGFVLKNASLLPRNALLTRILKHVINST
jgi:hypothetical protein